MITPLLTDDVILHLIPFIDSNGDIWKARQVCKQWKVFADRFVHIIAKRIFEDAIKSRGPFKFVLNICSLDYGILDCGKTFGETGPPIHRARQFLTDIFDRISKDTLSLKPLGNLPKRIRALNETIEEGSALRIVWGRTRAELEMSNLDEPGEYASPAKVREWMDINRELLGRVTELHLSSQSMRRLPKEIALFVNLKKLWISNNSLRFVPEELKHLLRLEKLNLGRNCIQEFPEKIGDLVHTPHNKYGIKKGYYTVPSSPKLS